MCVHFADGQKAELFFFFLDEAATVHWIILLLFKIAHKSFYFFFAWVARQRFLFIFFNKIIYKAITFNCSITLIYNTVILKRQIVVISCTIPLINGHYCLYALIETRNAARRVSSYSSILFQVQHSSNSHRAHLFPAYPARRSYIYIKLMLNLSRN